MATQSAGNKAPQEFVNRMIGNHVSIKLNTGVEYRGKLVCLDAFMNVVLDGQTNNAASQSGQVEEWIDGQCRGKYGTCFLRGNNVQYITRVN
ncbi:hypothetical protein MP228_005702 [Amoeboaphelidium protococcarum]|nr:hypothetical protein MP228_005702 [Amoeboaphelidium protococcarum]